MKNSKITMLINIIDILSKLLVKPDEKVRYHLKLSDLCIHF